MLLQIYPRKFQVQDDQMWDFGAEATDLLSCYPLVGFRHCKHNI